MLRAARCVLSLAVAARGLQLGEIRVSLAKAALEDVAWRRAVEKATRSVTLEGDPVAVATISRAKQLALAVLDEEEYRATQMVSRGGAAVRPRDVPADVRGPLGDFEARVADAVEHSPWNVLTVVSAWLSEVIAGFDSEVEAVVQSEMARAKRTAATGDRLRPLDAPPSALGKLELFVDALVKEEMARASTGRARPVENEAGMRGPLAAAERRAAALFDVISRYETERLEALKDEGLITRPMDRSPQDALGFVEGVAVGVVRAPILVSALISRIQELIDEVRADADAAERLWAFEDDSLAVDAPSDDDR